jgi:hypothetical protein
VRAAGKGDEGALQKLFGNIWHQGTVYEATAPAVPFLVELLASPRADRAGVLELLGLIATGSSFHDVHRHIWPPSRRDSRETLKAVEQELGWVRAARDAVHDHLPVIFRSLDDVDGAVRTAALGVATAFADKNDAARMALVRHAFEDADGGVRIFALDALRKCGALDNEMRERAIREGGPAARVLVGCALLRAGRAAELAPDGKVIAMLQREAPLVGDALDALTSGWGAISLTIEELDGLLEEQVHLLRSWLQHKETAVRSSAIQACSDVIDGWRAAGRLLVPALVQRLDDDDVEVRADAARTIGKAGRAGDVAVEALARTLAREPLAESDAAQHALVALCARHDARAEQVVANALIQLTTAGPRRLFSRRRRGPIELPRYLSLAIDHVGPWADTCLPPLLALLPRAAEGNDRLSVINAVGRFGAAAAPAIPALRAELTRHPHGAVRVLGDLGSAARVALRDVSHLLDHHDGYVRAKAARAVWHMTGELATTLTVLEQMLGGDTWHQRAALELITEIGPAAAGISRDLPSLFDEEDEWISMHAAVAYFAVTGDANATVAALVPRHVVSVPRGHEGIRCVGRIGSAARVALPQLRAIVESPKRLSSSGFGESAADFDERLMDEAIRAIAQINAT